MTGYLWIPILAAYLAAAVTYARAALRRWESDPNSLTHGSHGVDRGISAAAALLFGLIWPLSIAWLALSRWLWKPTDEHLQRVEQMVTDRDMWRDKARTATTEDERATAATIVETLDDLITRTRGTTNQTNQP